MIDINFLETLKDVTDKLKDNTLNRLLERDTNYQKHSEKEGVAERTYIEMNLTKPQRKIIDEYLALVNSTNSDYSILCYLAGLLDSSKIHALIDPDTKSDVNSVPTIRNLYNGNLYPGENIDMSDTAKKLCTTLSEREILFNSTLTDIQQNTFQDILDIRLHTSCLDIEESFVSGFQHGARLIMEVLSM